MLDVGAGVATEPSRLKQKSRYGWMDVISGIGSIHRQCKLNVSYLLVTGTCIDEPTWRLIGNNNNGSTIIVSIWMYFTLHSGL